MRKWFTADFHFGHESIIAYTGRPFETGKEMDREIIKRFNSKVAEDDVAYILGDFTMDGPNHTDKIENLVRKLNGRKILILGNHDRLKALTYVDIGFESVHTSLYLESVGVFLVHDPATSIIVPSKTWLCGHVHTLFKQVKNVINVGVDVWDYYPVSWEEIEKLIAT